VATIPKMLLASKSTWWILVIPALLQAVSILASPVAISPKMDVAEAFPILLEEVFDVAVIGAFTSV